MIRIWIAFLGALIPFCLQAQRDEFGAFLSITNYRGEVSSFNVNSPGTGFGGFMRQNWSEAFSSRYSFMYAEIGAKDANSKDAVARSRNFSFSTEIIEFSLLGEYNFFHFRSPRQNQPFTPYIFGGVAYFRMKPTRNNPPYSLDQISIPFGVGVKLVAGEHFNLGLEFGARKTFTDQLDDIYPDPNRNPLLFTGNVNDRDMYFVTQFSLSYTIYSTSPCPAFYRKR